jgi:hypothetical protein
MCSTAKWTWLSGRKMLHNSAVEADVALGRSAPSGPRSLMPVVRKTREGLCTASPHTWRVGRRCKSTVAGQRAGARPSNRTAPRRRAQSSMTDGDAQVRGAIWTAVRACRSVGPDCASRLWEQLIWPEPADSRRRTVRALRGLGSLVEHCAPSDGNVHNTLRAMPIPFELSVSGARRRAINPNCSVFLWLLCAPML